MWKGGGLEGLGVADHKVAWMKEFVVQCWEREMKGEREMASLLGISPLSHRLLALQPSLALPMWVRVQTQAPQLLTHTHTHIHAYTHMHTQKHKWVENINFHTWLKYRGRSTDYVQKHKSAYMYWLSPLFTYKDTDTLTHTVIQMFKDSENNINY